MRSIWVVSNCNKTLQLKEIDCFYPHSCYHPNYLNKKIIERIRKTTKISFDLCAIVGIVFW